MNRNIDTPGKLHQPRAGKRQKRYSMLISFCLLLCVVVIGISGYQLFHARYQQDQMLAQQATKELQVAISQTGNLRSDTFNARQTVSVLQHYTDALTTFAHLQGDLAAIPDTLSSLPNVGTRIQTAKSLVSLAMYISQSGVAGANIWNLLATKLGNPLNTAAQLSPTDLATLNLYLSQLSVSLNNAVQSEQLIDVNNLQSNPGINSLLGILRQYQPQLQQELQQAKTLLSVAPLLLGIGKPAYYLIECLDSTELRPGGGFIGNYGIVTVTGGHLASGQVMDADTLDHSGSSQNKSYPQYAWFSHAAGNQWDLSNSNLDADFPTSAYNAATLYTQEGGKFPLAGVLAITPKFIQNVITLTGPIQIPQYHETVTAQNLIDRIHYHQLVEKRQKSDKPAAAGYSSARKNFTALLGQYLLQHMRALPIAQLPTLLHIFVDAVQTKDVQINFQVDAAEQILHFYHLDAALQTPDDDSMYVVDTNMLSNKANQYLITTVHDQVTLEADGSAIHQTSIETQWTPSALHVPDIAQYKGYLRVYVPSQSVLLTQSGWHRDVSGQAFGNIFWSGYTSMNYPHISVITLKWRIADTAKSFAGLWHYQDLLQHQAGAQQNIDVQITLPPCGRIVNASTDVKVDKPTTLHSTQALERNKEISVVYTCQ